MPIQKLETNNVLKEWLDTINSMIDNTAEIEANVNNKVDKVAGKGLSTEDFTTALKTKLEDVEEGANKYVLPTATDTITGGVRLSDSISSNSSVSDGIAATPKAVKEAYDLANAALPKSGGTITGDLTVDGTINAKISGNAETATKLANAGKIELSGGATGQILFDGSDTSVQVTIVDDSHNHTIENIDNLDAILNTKASLSSPTFDGIPKAPTAASTDNSTQIATTEFVQAVVDSKIAAADAMIYKGTIGNNGTIQELPAEHSIGWTYKVVSEGTYAGVKCNIGDMIICLADGTSASDADWSVIEGNIDGAVTGPVSSIDGQIAIFDGSTGKVIKDSGFTIAKSVPADAKFTDTTYSIGTDSTAGVTKLYSELGTAEDGAMTQAAVKSALDTKADASEVLLKTEQTLTDEEKEQVRQNLRFIGKNVTGQEFTIDGKTVTASESAEIFGDYDNNIATGQWSIAEGSQTVATGRASHAEGALTQALADGSHTEGYGTKATGYWSHAEGEMTVVSSYASHAEGSYCTMPDGSKRYTTASGYASHAEGGGTLTSGSCAHAEGLATTASGNQSHVEGRYTIAAGSAQHVEGTANIEDTEDKYLHIAGNGTFEERSNAHTLDWEGNAWFSGDVYVGSTSGKDKDEGSKKVATEDYVQNLYKKLNTNTVLGFYCIEDVTIVTNGISTVHPANSNVEVKFIEDDTWEIIPTSNNSILTLNAFPGALGTFYPWLEGVKQFSNILFDMNSEEMYTKWNQGNQGAYQVQYAQYTNCIFWSDLPYISEVSKRTNYTLYYSAQIPLCYSNIPDNTFKSFYLAFNVNSDPNWGNKLYRDSFAKATWATQAFSYYGGRTIGIFDHDNAAFNITLPKDCRGLMYAASAVENAGVFDATNTTNFGAKSGSWRDAFGLCKSLRNLYIKNLKVDLNISWSSINYDSIYFIISEAANTNSITITLSPYTYNLLSQSDFELAASKNITIEMLTTNYVEDKRLSAITITGDGSKVLGDDGTYKTLPTKTSQLENDNSFVNSTELASHASVVANDTTLGHVYLTDSIDSELNVSNNYAATPKAVKEAYDLASAALPKEGGVITGDLTVEGTINAKISGTITGNAETATKLANPGVIALSGDATGSVSFDGSDAVLEVTIVDDSHNHTIANIDNLQATLLGKASTTSPTFSGVPTAPTASLDTNTKQIATTEFVHNVVAEKIAAADAMIFKGTIGEDGTVSSLPATHAVGWTYKVITAGEYAGVQCNVGDMIVCLVGGDSANDTDWTVIEGNIDGAVTGPSSSIDNNIVIFDGSTGKVIKDSGFTIESSVPADAKFTDTTYTASDGIELDGNNFINTGVRDISDGTSDGVISVDINGTIKDISVGGLKSAAYTDSSDYAPITHVTAIANADISAHVALSDAINSTSGVASGVAATPKAVKEAYDLASAALPKEGGVITGDLTVEGTINATIAGNAETANEAGKLSAPRTIAFSGDVSGSGSFDGSEDIAIEITVADDSHNHTIANIDNLQATLLGKAPTTSPVFTGTPTAPTATVGTNTTQIATTEFVNTSIGNAVDSLVSGPANSTIGHVAVFDTSTGKAIKDSGFTIESSVPADAKFTDTRTNMTSSEGIHIHSEHTNIEGDWYDIHKVINTGIVDVYEGSTDGTIGISYNASTGSELEYSLVNEEVPVKGLKSAAFTESSAYASSAHTSVKASDTVLGHVYLTDNIDSETGISDAIAATPKAVKQAFEDYKNSEEIVEASDVSWTTNSVIPKDSVVTINGGVLYPYGMNAIIVSVDGIVLSKGTHYEEVGTQVGDFSDKVKFLFEVEPESTINVWVSPQAKVYGSWNFIQSAVNTTFENVEQCRQYVQNASSINLFDTVVEVQGSTIDVSLAGFFRKEVTSDITFDFINCRENASCCVTLVLINGGNYLVEWDSSVYWADGTPSTLTENGIDVITFFTINGGTTWYATPTILNAKAI